MARQKKVDVIRADGRCEVKITIGKNADGTTIRKTFYSYISKGDAREKAKQYQIEQEVLNKTGEKAELKNVTFDAWANKWLETTKKCTVKNYTYMTTYKSKIDKYLVPYFKNAIIRNIKQIDIQTFFSAHSYLSKSMLDKFRIILFSLFELAIDNDLCIKNPVKNIKIADNNKVEKHTYTQEQVNKLVRHCIDNQIADILILLKTGIRRSELLGLTWGDINLTDKHIHINSAVTPDYGSSVEDVTKSISSNRIIPIDNQLTEFLIKNNSSPSMDTNIYIVTGVDAYMSPSGYAKRYKKQMQSIATQLAIPALTPHELRHTFGTLLREQGVDIYTIQKLMGHANISITAKIYVHNNIDVLRKAMKIDNDDKNI